MKAKLIILEQSNVIVNDDEIRLNDIVAETLSNGKIELFTIHTLNDIDKDNQKKVIAFDNIPNLLSINYNGFDITKFKQLSNYKTLDIEIDSNFKIIKIIQ